MHNCRGNCVAWRKGGYTVSRGVQIWGLTLALSQRHFSFPYGGWISGPQNRTDEPSGAAKLFCALVLRIAEGVDTRRPPFPTVSVSHIRHRRPSSLSAFASWPRGVSMGGGGCPSSPPLQTGPRAPPSGRRGTAWPAPSATTATSSATWCAAPAIPPNLCAGSNPCGGE